MHSNVPKGNANVGVKNILKTLGSPLPHSSSVLLVIKRANAENVHREVNVFPCILEMRNYSILVIQFVFWKPKNYCFQTNTNKYSPSPHNCFYY